MEQLLSDENLCTFALQLCDTNKWEAIDLDQWMLDKINSKPQVAKTNDFVNHLYERIANDKEQ